MAPIDPPIKLKFSNGNNFPDNFVYISYAVLAVGLVLALTGEWIIGAAIFVVDLFVVTNRHFVIINVEENYVHDYAAYLGFIKVGKKYPLDKYRYITAMPLIESTQVMANYAQSTTDSRSYFEVNMFGERLRGKRQVTKFNTRSEAQEVAEKLAGRLGLKYFEYDPKLVRDILTGHKTL